MTFQSIEEDRLSSVRDSLWRVANIASLAAVADDLSAEEVRKTLETSKLDDTIQAFIAEYASGKNRYRAQCLKTKCIIKINMFLFQATAHYF